MGMTIEEHTAQLKKLKSFHNGSYGASINYAIDTMRKYQKIEEIYERFQKDGGYYYHMARLVDELREVIEDGKID